MKTAILLLALSLLSGTTAYAEVPFFKSKKTKKETIAEKKVSAYDKLFASPHPTAKGFITLHKLKNKLYFELPLNLLQRDMLLGSTVSEVSDNGNAIVGSKPSTPIHFRFHKVNGKINMAVVQTGNISDNDSRINAAMKLNNIDAILQTFDIAAYNNDSSAVTFDVTDLFVGDNKLIEPFDKYSTNLSGGRKRNTSFKKSLSYIEGIKSFKDNLSIRSCLSYTYSLTGGKGKKVEDAPFTAKMTRSILLLDSVPYRPRIVDSRIGIFPTDKKVYSAAKQNTREIYYANRWRLEPSDTAAYMAGEKVTPTKPIVFYIDSCFPEAWKKSVFAAVRQWNEPFEKIGFKNAIEAREFPKNDPEFDADNLKYSCIRYAPIAIENAMGPSWVDPRSGEILNASVYLYHDVVKLLNSWLFIQTSQADKRTRHSLIPSEVLEDGLRYVVSHEVGHCLGFMHNMSASSVVPVDSLRSASYTQKYGTTTSIMDYARFNYVAQPGDMEKGVAMMPPHFGLYDYYLIRWNYTPVLSAKTPEEEYKITSEWITKATADPVFRYGKQQSEILDPRSQTEDLSDDAVKASGYGISNLKYILSHMNEWLKNEDDDYSHRSDLYDGIIMQYLTYMMHVYHNIGGIYLQEKHVGDPVETLLIEDKAKQKEAMDFFLKQLAEMEWIDNANILQVLPLVGSPADVLRNVLMKQLMAAPGRVEFAASKAGSKGYGVEECMDDIYQFIWKPTIQNKTLTNAQIKMQNAFIVHLAKTAGIKWNQNAKSLTSGNGYEAEFLQHLSDVAAKPCGCGECFQSSVAGLFNPIAGFDEPMAEYFVPRSQDSMCYGYFLRIRDLLEKHQNSGDKNTRMHYALLLRQIKNALNR